MIKQKKNPIVTIDKTLEKYKDKPLVQDKLGEPMKL